MTIVVMEKKEAVEKTPFALTVSRKEKLENISRVLGRPQVEIISALIDCAELDNDKLVITQQPS